MLLRTQGDRWVVLSMSAETKEKLYTKVLVLNPAKRLNISLQVERLQKGMRQNNLCSQIKHVVIWFLQAH